MTPELFGFISAALAVIAYPPYFFSTLKGKTRPHAFSWVLWTLLTWVAFAIQVEGGAGPGAWSTGITGFCTTLIAVVSLKFGEKNITRSDWVAFVAGLCAIPLWIWTKDPTASAILVTIIDLFGFYPTYRKSWHRPHEEMMRTHALSLAKHAVSLPALVVISIPTALYPAALLLANVGLVGMIWMRRLKAETRIS